VTPKGRRFASGLVVGKFCPLHRGHELVIRRALDDCDRVFVLTWSRPELAGCEPERRAAWLARLFPAVEALVLTDARLAALDPPAEVAALPANADDVGHLRRFTAWVCEAAWRVRPDAIFTSEPDGADFAAALTAWFRRGDPDRPAVAAVLVDPARRLAPISGTALRADIHAHRGWLSPEVYRDFVRRAALLGGESTGKSSLARAVARRLGTVHVAEYGRELWEARAGQLALADLLHIAEEQVAREESAAGRAREWLICDTTPLTTLFYSRHLFGRADPALEALAARRYDLVVLCEPDFPFVQDGTRQDDAFRQLQHAWYIEELRRREVPFLSVSGDPDRRIAAIERAASRR
jgi:HTH-type transcriptional regulator, transcriptional repressor of NAD biosynthesis genes